MKEIYRIKNGIIECVDLKMHFFFGIVFIDGGVIELDIYINEEFDLRNLTENNIWQEKFTITSKTEENNTLLFDELRLHHVYPGLSKIKMSCLGKMEHIKKDKGYKDQYNSKEYISYLLIEGLNLEFTDITEEIRLRNGIEINSFDFLKRDHISTNLVYQNFSYGQTYYQQDESEGIVVEFKNDTSNEDDYQMSYERFLEIKKDYISFLSFINGAETKIRKECYGTYHSCGKIDAQKVVTYSFKKIINYKYSKYLPLNNFQNRTEKVLSKSLERNFKHFVEWNKTIDLNSIIFYLSNSQQSKSIQEMVFIQIIAFERLSTMYVEYLGQKEEYLPSKIEYEFIKNQLLKIIDENKNKFGNAYNTVKSKIGNLNQIKRHSTTDKMYRIINDCGIPIHSKLENLIEVVRHKTVHRGDIGEQEEATLNYYLLDELIREIILRMIKYKGKRNSLALLKDDI